ncbi:type VI secretion-associated protein, ImpA family [compost metagenome]
MKAKTKSPKSVPAPAIRFADLALPVEADRLCGDDLEYDPEFVVLQAKAAPRESAQYGDFVAPAEPLNWTELERDCRRLLLRTKDIRLLTLFLRCRTRMEQAEGLRDGLALLYTLLSAYPAQLHPQLEVDGEEDPALRANALAALADPEGLLADVREIGLGGSNTLRLQVRDIERALGMPRPADALAPESVRQQLDALRQQGVPAIAAMDEACALALAVQRWSETNLPGYAPDLDALPRLLRLAGDPELAQPAVVQAESAIGAPVHLPSPPPIPTDAGAQPDLRHDSADMPADRHAALVQIRAAREWFEDHEPSSPVSLLLRQAEHLVGKPFAEVFQAIPAELVERWAQETT